MTGRVLLQPAPRRPLLASLAILLLVACSGDDGAAITTVTTATATPAAGGLPPSSPTSPAQPSPPPAATTAAEPPPTVVTGEALPPRTEWTTARITTDDLNVRVEPSTEAAIVGRLDRGDEVFIAGRSVDGNWLAIAGAGWVFNAVNWIDLGVVVGNLSPVAADAIGWPLQPADARTGVEQIDAMIGLLLASNVAALQDLVVLSALPCAAREYSPPCPGDVPNGTPVSIFLAGGGCHLGAALISDIAAAITHTLGAPGSLSLFAVRDGATDAAVPTARYTLEFAAAGGTAVLASLHEDGRLLGLNGACGAGVAPVSASYLLPPVVLPPLRSIY